MLACLTAYFISIPNDRATNSCSRGLPLPPGGGPHLHQFQDAGAAIKWLKRLDTDRKGNQAFVFHVSIASKEYALKVFKFNHPNLNRYYRDMRMENIKLPLKEAIWYTDPFYAECRAYGRIEEALKSGLVTEHIAVKCYGYLLLNKRDARWLEEQGIDLDHQLLDPELREALSGDTRIRAIVKQFGKGPGHVHAGNIRRAWRSVYFLNNYLKIYNMDIKADNFIGYRLVDFGSSWTEPHKLLDYLGGIREDLAKANRYRDTVNFQDMIEEEGIPTRLRVMAKSKHQLRSKGAPEWADRELPKRRRKAPK
ncbi:kinetochore Sim4 complex subunit FTA2-domain-containing protein [Nemania sp. FL0031]|nr:kinetochore Sim4 complex subunit FTA2-domain-containing protein [Nemania sp. FL0031]